MRVPFNAYTETFINQVNQLNRRQVSLQQQLSNGQRITEASDDPSAMGRALDTATEKLRIQTQTRNLNRAELIGTFTLDTLEQLKVVADEVTITANTTDGLTSMADFRARGLQVNQLVEQSLRVANTEISGDFLFGGANTAEQPFVPVRYVAGDVYLDRNGNVRLFAVRDRNGNEIADTTVVDTSLTPGPGDPRAGIDSVTNEVVQWNGSAWENILDDNGNPIVVTPGADPSGTGVITSFRNIDPELIGMVAYIEYRGTTDPAEDISFRIGETATVSPFSRGAANVEYGEFFNDMIALRDAYFGGQLTEVVELIPNFDNSQQMVNFGLVEFGSLLKGLEVTTRINESRFNELEKLSSRELDIDTAETIVLLNRSQTAYEAALSSGARILNLSLLDFLR